MNRSLAVNYCDDIRTEIGNKISLMGLYGSELIVPSFPAILSKFCVFAQVFNNAGERFEGTLAIRVLMNDEVVHEQLIECIAKTEPPMGEGTFEKRTIVLVLSPFEIKQSGKLRVRAYFGDQELKGSALSIRAPDEERGQLLSS